MFRLSLVSLMFLNLSSSFADDIKSPKTEVRLAEFKMLASDRPVLHKLTLAQVESDEQMLRTDVAIFEGFVKNQQGREGYRLYRTRLNRNGDTWSDENGNVVVKANEKFTVDLVKAPGQQTLAMENGALYLNFSVSLTPEDSKRLIGVTPLFKDKHMPWWVRHYSALEKGFDLTCFDWDLADHVKTERPSLECVIDFSQQRGLKVTGKVGNYEMELDASLTETLAKFLGANEFRTEDGGLRLYRDGANFKATLSAPVFKHGSRWHK